MKLRHARLTLPDATLDELHDLKRHLSRERGQPVTLDELLGEGATLLLRYHGRVAERPEPPKAQTGGGR